MPRLVVISGPANSGKMPLARVLLAGDPELILVHRDHLRHSFEVNQPDEWHITILMAELARGILKLEFSPIVVAWNLDPSDRLLWNSVAADAAADLEWMDVREPSVAKMIPPLPVGAA